MNLLEITDARNVIYWDKVIRTEIELIKKNNTWTLKDLFKEAKLIGSM